MTPDESVSDRQPAKRPRTTTACQSCRARKLSCGGSRPCARCRQDGRECTDAVMSERTPLTRKRMTDFEERLADHNLIWSALFPQLPLDTARDWLLNIGLDATVQRVRAIANLGPSSVIESATPLHLQSITNTGSSNPVPSPLFSKTTPDVSSAQIASSPTRPSSPHIDSVRIPLNLHDVPHSASNAWNEDNNTTRDGPSAISGTERDTSGATPGNDFGTGVRAGVGYIGLSSAATLLRAIQKFAPEELLPPNYRLTRGIESTAELTSANLARISRPLAVHDDGRLPPVLPPYSEIGPLVDAYFKYFHALTPIVHEPTVRAQITGALPIPTGCGSGVLFNMIFATGAFDSALEDDPGTDGRQYYEEARVALQQDLLEGGSIMLVQGLAIMAIWLQRCNKPNAGYVCLGLAIRMATALGVHVSAPTGHESGLTVLEAEMRSRLWWGLVALENGQSLTYGRPHGISLPSLSAVRLPVNTDDGYLTVSTTQTPPDVPRITLYTALITQARLAQIAFHSLDRISRSLPCPTAHQIKRCGDQFRDQLAALPTYMQANNTSSSYRLAGRVQVWRGRDYRSILYRPVLLSAAWHTNGLSTPDETVQEIVHICRTLAMENLQDIAEFVRTDPDPHRGCEWYTLYFCIQASLTILLSIVWEPHHPSAPAWRASIQETIPWLRQLGSMKELGMSYAQIMENVLATRIETHIEIAAEVSVMPAQHSEQHPTDLDGLDFERYFSEIWEGQPQFAIMTGDLSLGMVPDMWEDMVTRPGGH